MVREVTLTNSEETWDSGHQLVVNPDTTHCIVDSREDHHWVVVLHAVNLVSQLTWVNVGNLLIHIEEVAITLQDNVNTETVDRLREVEEYGKTCVVDTEALVATLLSCTRSHVTRNQVTECWVTALQVVVAVFLRNIRTLLCTSLQCLGILNLLRNPDTTIVTE